MSKPIFPKFKSSPALQAAMYYARKRQRLVRIAAAIPRDILAAIEATDIFAALGTLASFSTFDPAKTDASITLSNGDLTATGSTIGSFRLSLGKTGHSTGKYYNEFFIVAQLAAIDLVGIANASAPQNYLGSDNNAIGWDRDGRTLITSSNQLSVATWTTGDTLGIALDLDNGKVWFRNGAGGWNNDVIGNQNPATNTGGISPAVAPSTSGTAYTVNFGASAYANAAPSGFGNW